VLYCHISDYPSDTGSQKGRKISSRTTNGQADSRHNSGHGHSAVVPPPYFKEDENEDARGIRMKTRDSEEEFGWRQEENEMSDQAFLEKSKEMLESFGPLAVTNLAWKSLHSEINKDGGSSSIGHWDDPDRKGSLLPSSSSHKPSVDYDKSKDVAAPTITPSVTSTGTTARHNVCSPQDYEILKVRGLSYDINLDISLAFSLSL